MTGNLAKTKTIAAEITYLVRGERYFFVVAMHVTTARFDAMNHAGEDALVFTFYFYPKIIV